MVARLGRLSKLLDKIVSIYEKRLGELNSWNLATSAMKACGDLLPMQEYAYAKLKWNISRIITSRHISQMIMLNKLKKAEILITINIRFIMQAFNHYLQQVWKEKSPKHIREKENLWSPYVNKQFLWFLLILFILTMWDFVNYQTKALMDRLQKIVSSEGRFKNLRETLKK